MKDLMLGFDKDKNRVYIDEETRALHMHVIGSTGTGKSKFLEWMIRGDIRAGRGLCLIDPHGDLYDGILRWCGSQGYLNRRKIVLLNPSAGDFATAFNPFARMPGPIDVQVNRRVLVTLKAWGVDNSDQTPRLETWLRNIFWVLMEKGLTLVEAAYFIKYADAQAIEMVEHLTANVSNSGVADAWQLVVRQLHEAWEHGRTPRDYKEQTESTFNRLQRFLSSQTLMAFMGQLDRNIDLAEMMEKGQVFLVNLKESDRLDGMNARLFGTLLVNQLYEVAKRRVKPEDKPYPRPFYLYLDEFQNFATHDIDKILAEARKMGLHLILSHQTLDQVTDVIKPGVLLTNTRTKVVFGGLDRESALTMVDEMFVNQLDMQERKEKITEEKYHLELGREEVRTHGRATTRSSGHSSGSGSVINSGFGTSTGTSFVGFEGFFAPAAPSTQFSSTSSSNARADSSSEADTDGYAETENEAFSDVPFYHFVPYQEAPHLFSLEEQRTRAADQLKQQWTRQCFIKIMNERAQPMLVPNVATLRVLPSRVRGYERRLMEKSPYSLPLAQAQEAIAQRQRALLAQLVRRPLPSPDNECLDLPPADIEEIPKTKS